MKPLWAIQFNVDDSVWEELCAQAGPLEKTPLSLALEQGLLNENHLIAWERENSGISSLKDIFFNGEPPLELWSHYDFKLCSKNYCMPIATWDDKVYWAKLSSEVSEMESGLTDVVWVLAPWGGLKKWFMAWKVLSGGDEILQVKEADEPQGFETEDAEGPAILSGTTSGFPTGLGKSIETLPSIPNIDFGNLKMPSPHHPTEPSISSVTGTQIDYTPPEEKEALTREFAVPAPALAPIISTQGLPPRPSLSLNKFEAVPPPPITQQEIIAIPLELLSEKLQQASTQEQLASVIMGGWLNYFEKMMILLTQGNGLVVWRWSGIWFGNFQRGQTLPLDTPSIFKIAHDTSHPYHGYVSPGPTNDLFFSMTNGKQYPEHVTILPVITDGAVVAMLFGGCSKEMGKNISLNKLEDQAKLFATGLLKFATPVPKAS